MDTPDLRRQCARQALLLGALVVVASLLGSYSYRHQSGPTSLEIEAEIAAGSLLEVFPNQEVQDRARAQRIQPGQRMTYVFADLPQPIERLRIDPTDAPGVRVRLWRLTVREGRRVLRSLGPAELAGLSWDHQMSVSPSSAASGAADYLEVTTTGRDPILRLPSASLGVHDWWPWRIWRQLSGGLWLFLAAPCLLFLCARTGSFGPLLPVTWLLIAAVPGLGLLWKTPLLQRALAGYQSSDGAVGFANYTGYPKLAEHRVVLLSVALIAALSYLLARWTQRLRWVLPPIADRPLLAADGGWCRRVQRGLLCLLLLIGLGERLPDLPFVLDSLQHGIHRPNFDANNHLAWNYAYWAGWVPLRDFWYPYADFIQHFASTASGFGKGLFHLILTWVVVGYCVFRLADRSYGVVSLVFGLVALATPYDLMTAESRYNLSLGLVLLGVLSRKHGWRLRDGLWLAVFAGYSLPYEVHQVVYAAVPIAVVWLLDLLFVPPGTSRRAMLRWLAAVSSALLLFVAIWMLDLARQGRLPGQLDFLLHTAGMVSYASLASNVLGWFAWPSDRVGLLLHLMLGCVGLGVFARSLVQRGPWADIGTLSLACGLLGALTMQKQIVRPHIAHQLMPLVVLPLVFWLAVLYRAARGFIERATLVALTVVAFTTAFGLAPYGLALRYCWERVSRLPASIGILADSATLDAAQQHYFFAPEAYPELVPLLSRLRQLIGPDPGHPTPQTPFMVLGDESYLYVALRQKPAPYIAYYDSSPLTAQQRMVRWLREQQPRLVVWRPGVANFDLVPNVVRVPRLFSAVVADYEWQESVGDSHILRRRAPNQPIDWSYFRRELGTSIDLRALPGHSRLGSLPLCQTPSPDAANSSPRRCVPILQVHVAQPIDQQALKLTLSTEHGDFAVALTQLAGVSDYAVSLSSLWFWPSLRDHSPAAALAWSAPAGTTLQITWRAGADEILF